MADSLEPFDEFNSFQDISKELNSSTYFQSKNQLMPNKKAKSIIYKLQQTWDLFIIMPIVKGSKIIPPKLFGNFNTVQGMWEYINNISISNLPNGYGYGIFQDGCKPIWEDEKNKSGARMMVSINNDNNELIESFFLESCMLLFGGSLGIKDVTGIIFAKRERYTRIAIWMSDYLNLDVARQVGLQFKAFLPNHQFEFQKHNSNDYNNYLLVL